MPPTAKPTQAAKPVVVLFDVDETLVHTGGSGTRSWKAAFDKLYGIPADIGEHSSAGETDPQVARATFKAVLGRDPSDDELSRLYAQYLLHLASDIGVSQGYRVLPGAEKTLLRLGEAGVMLGLVSGAMEGAARTKLGLTRPHRTDRPRHRKGHPPARAAQRQPSLRRGRHPPRHGGDQRVGRGVRGRGQRSLLGR